MPMVKSILVSYFVSYPCIVSLYRIVSVLYEYVLHPGAVVVGALLGMEYRLLKLCRAETCAQPREPEATHVHPRCPPGAPWPPIDASAPSVPPGAPRCRACRACRACRPVPPGAVRCRPVPPGAVRCRPVPPGAARCRPVPCGAAGAVRCHLVLGLPHTALAANDNT